MIKLGSKYAVTMTNHISKDDKKEAKMLVHLRSNGSGHEFVKSASDDVTRTSQPPVWQCLTAGLE